MKNMSTKSMKKVVPGNGVNVRVSSDCLGPSAAPASEGAAGAPPSVPDNPGEGDPAGPSASRNAVGPRRPCSRDLGETVPGQATLRRYDPDGKSAYWAATLPPRVADAIGRHARTPRWGFWTGRSELEVINDLMDWIQRHYAGPTP